MAVLKRENSFLVKWVYAFCLLPIYIVTLFVLKEFLQPYSRRSFLRTSASLLLAASRPDLPPPVNLKPVHITLLHTSDIHGQLQIHDEFFWQNGSPEFKKRGGLATLKTIVREFRKKNKNTLLFDSGDCLQGSGVAQLSEGRAMIPLLNSLEYDAIVPGNWEVIYGKNRMITDLSGCHAAKVCTNMYHEGSGEFIFPPYKIFGVGGVKIGVIGYNDAMTPVRQSPAYSHGIRFSAPEENMAAMIHLLKEEHRCDIIVALTHLGMAQQLYLSNQPYAEGINYVFGGDTHERIRKPIEGKFAKVVEPGAFASFIGKLDIVVENGKVKDEIYELVEVDPEKYAADKEMSKLIRKECEPYEKDLSGSIGKTTTPLYRYFILETPMDNLITDGLMWKIKPDIALSNGFRFCPPLVPDKVTGVAEITREYLWSMLPVDAEIKMAEVTGAQMWEWLEQELENVFSTNALNRFGGWLIRFNGMKIKFTIKNEFGRRLQQVLVKGQNIDFKKTYSILACEREGDPNSVLCRIKDIKSPSKPGYRLHQVMEEYLRVHVPARPEIEGRAVATDAPSNLLTQSMGVDYEFR